MIEAVKSTVANSALLRGSVDQSSTLNSFAANPDKVQTVSQAPYVSPRVRVDVNTKIAILEFREALSGEVLAQIPSEQAIRTYKLREARGDAQLAAKLTEKPSVQEGTKAERSATPAPTVAQEHAPAPEVHVAPVPETSSAPAPAASTPTEVTVEA
ncbi:MAG TPA: hypothetical protein VIN59_05875 [Alphaproteobacteria bacterium]